MTTLEACEITRPLAPEKLKGRVALITGDPGVGAAIGRGLASRLGRPDEVARVTHFLCAGASSHITCRECAPNGSQEI